MIITNGIIITPFEKLNLMDIKVHNGKIVEFIETGNKHTDNEEIIDAKGCYVFPGFVDIHTHGGGGSDFMDATEDDFFNALKFHSSNGTTSLLASTVSAPVEQIANTLKLIRKLKDTVFAGCRLLGAHLEGPFLSFKNRGAHLNEYLRTPDKDGYDFVNENADVIMNVTLSPELSGSLKMIEDIKMMGITISGGHDDAVDYEIMQAINAGMTNVTHVFCATSSTISRNGKRHTGLSEIGMIDDRLTVELIADNHHLTPKLVRLAYRCKGAHKACIVSDCLRAGGMPANDGNIYTLGSRYVENAQQAIVDGDVAVLPDRTRYAGSIQPLRQMIRNLVLDCNIPLNDAICMATYTPAKIIHMEHLIGSITLGKSADFCIMDRDFNVKKTIVQGSVVFDKYADILV